MFIICLSFAINLTQQQTYYATIESPKSKSVTVYGNPHSPSAGTLEPELRNCESLGGSNFAGFIDTQKRYHYLKRDLLHHCLGALKAFCRFVFWKLKE